MSFLNERVSYLKGLADGLGVTENTNEGKLMRAIIGVLEEFAEEIDLMENFQDEIAESVANISEDYDEYDDEEDEEIEFFEVECEKCGNKVHVDEEMLLSEEDIKCPSCGEPIEIEFECDDDCDCDCGCHEEK